ncbi:MAG: hypothetical protein LBN22_06850 [Clostridiales Family XIII bacterium]|jgi:hypothetical protein|nr:hypothetical protein [Clostridiales Family XIII bacterium]
MLQNANTLLNKLHIRFTNTLNNSKGMEMVQVAIIIGIAVIAGVIFKKQITGFVNNVFGELTKSKFYSK